MVCCKHDPFAKTLYYVDIPIFYTWTNKRAKEGRLEKEWKNKPRGIKTVFVTKLILTKVRRVGDVVIAVASFGTAAILIPD